MKTIVIIPTQKEFKLFVQSIIKNGCQAENVLVGKLPVVEFSDIGMTVACGGLGKVQFAIHTQHLLDTCPQWTWAICAGAAGALVEHLTVGDVVIATETVEHDIHNKFGRPLLPRFNGSQAMLSAFQTLSPVSSQFHTHFGPIASGDEDVVDTLRKQALHQRTGGLAVAWEGAGGARACQFSDVPFVEIRGITDGADGNAAADFAANLENVMANVATLIIGWVRASYQV